MVMAFGLVRGGHEIAKPRGQIFHNPVAFAALAIGGIPTLAALQASAFSTNPQINFVGGPETQLASAVGRTWAKLLVPPAAVGRKDRNVVLLAQPAPAPLKHQ